MYAIIRTGGKQVKASVGDVVSIERIKGLQSDKVEFKDVLLCSDGEKIHVGQPTLKDAVVSGTVLSEKKSKKIIVFKYKKRKNYHRKLGHRQIHMAVRIDKIKK